MTAQTHDADATPEEIAALAEDAPAAAATPIDGSSTTVAETRHEPEPILRAQTPTNTAARLSEVDQFEAGVEAAFDDGDITAAEYRQHLRTANDARAKVRWAEQKADLASEMAETALDQRWNREVRSFVDTTGAPIAKSRAAMLAFDEFVKEVTSDPKNAGLTDRQQLEKAHRLYLAEMEGVGFRSTPAREVETSLNNFDAIDRLADADPEAYEAAIAHERR